MANKQTRGDFDYDPNDYQNCYVCGVNFNKSRYHATHYGKRVCAWCQGRNAKSLVLLKLFVETLSTLPCEHVGPEELSSLETPVSDSATVVVHTPGCKCPTCQARSVLMRMDIKPHDMPRSRQ